MKNLPNLLLDKLLTQVLAKAKALDGLQFRLMENQYSKLAESHFLDASKSYKSFDRKY